METPEDNLALYDDWAERYEDEFANELGFLTPAQVADTFAEQSLPEASALLDVGAGTGLLGMELAKRGNWQIDALDLSQQMLAVAERKRGYRRLIAADLTQPLEIADLSYDAVLSTGTFTHGHVGLEAFDELLRISRPGADFVVSINPGVYHDRGFAAKFEALSGQITGMQLTSHQAYLHAGQGHQFDELLIAKFFKRG